jgi:hypothetical protein
VGAAPPLDIEVSLSDDVGDAEGRAVAIVYASPATVVTSPCAARVSGLCGLCRIVTNAALIPVKVQHVAYELLMQTQLQRLAVHQESPHPVREVAGNLIEALMAIVSM